jgi:hypothetical protein
MPSRREITLAVIQDLGSDYAWDLDQAMRSGWQNQRDQGGLQLSVIGYRIFRDLAGYEAFEFAVPNAALIPRNLILLDRRMTWPWAMVRARGGLPQMVMFSSQDAVMATLYGDLEQWLSSLENQ